MGPGGEKIHTLGELTVKVRTERHGGCDISSRVTFQGAKARKPLLAVSGVIDKGNTVVFYGSGSFILPNSCAGVALVRGHHRSPRTPSAACENGVFVLRTWEPEDKPSMGFSRRRALFKSRAPGCVSPGPSVKPLKEKELGPFGKLCTSNPVCRGTRGGVAGGCAKRVCTWSGRC